MSEVGQGKKGMGSWWKQNTASEKIHGFVGKRRSKGQNSCVLNVVFVMDTNLCPHKQFKCK